VGTHAIMSPMDKHENIKTRVSAKALQEIKKIKKATGLKSAEIIDAALSSYTNTYSEDNNDNSKPPNAVIDAAILSIWRPEVNESKETIEEKEPEIDIAAFFESLQPNTEYMTVPETKASPAVGDFMNKNKPRQKIMDFVKSQMAKPLARTSWAEFHKEWFNKKESFEKTIDNRINALIKNEIIASGAGAEHDDYPNKSKIAGDITPLRNFEREELTPEQKKENKEYRRGVYKLIREVSDDEWTSIEGVLTIPPQRGISIPKIILN